MGWFRMDKPRPFHHEYIYYDEQTFLDDPNDWYVQMVKNTLGDKFISVQYAEKY